jgi:Fur family transcriptional regulator, ferric uptake regulator
MSTELHEVVATRLRVDGQRYTSGRRALVTILAASDQPLTLPQVLRRARGMAQSSAYRNLAVLERANVVHRVQSTDEFARYELDEELTEHHHHLICEACGIVTDFTVPEDVERSLLRALDRVAARSSFRVGHHRLDLVGRCADCSAR